MSDRPLDPRLAQALALLGDYASRDASAAADAPADDGWLESSTDVLTPWYPQSEAPFRSLAAAAAPPVAEAAWDAYFARSPRSFDAHRDRPAPAGRAPARGTRNEISEADADAVVEALYEFVHALGRGDVPDALAGVSDDFHAMDGEREVTRDALRHRLESMIDARRGRGLAVSLARVPEPVAHPPFVLVKIALQVDSDGPRGVPESLVLHRVAVFARTDGWRMVGLGDAAPLA